MSDELLFAIGGLIAGSGAAYFLQSAIRESRKADDEWQPGQPEERPLTKEEQEESAPEEE